MTDTPITTLINQLAAAAESDKALRSALISDPCSVLKKKGLDIPRDLQVQVDEREDGGLDIRVMGSDELSDGDLGQVSGGVAFL